MGDDLFTFLLFMIISVLRFIFYFMFIGWIINLISGNNKYKNQNYKNDEYDSYYQNTYKEYEDPNKAGIDPYTVLGVSKNSSIDEVKKSYKKLANKYHPDKNKSPDATKKMAEINAAYDRICKEKIKKS